MREKSLVQLQEKMRAKWSWIAILILIVIMFYVRLNAFNFYLTPSGSDCANYLTVLHAWNGYNMVGYQIQVLYPPLYFFLVLQPLSFLFGELSALKISASLLSSIIALPFFVLVKKITKSEVIALLMAFLFAFAESFNAIISWGGQPNLLALFFMLFSIYFFYEMVDRESRKHAVLAGVFLSLTAGSHHLVFPYYALVLGFSMFGSLLIKRKEVLPLIKNFSVLVLVGGLLCLPFMPIYYYFVDNFLQASVASPIIEYNLLLYAFDYVFGWGLVFWLLISILGVIGFLLEYKNQKLAVVLIIGFSLSSLIYAFVLLPSGISTRPIYFLIIPVFLAFGVFLNLIKKKLFMVKLEKRDYIRKMGILVIIFMILMVSLSMVGFSHLRLISGLNYYNTADYDVLIGLNWLKYNTPPTAQVFTTDYPLAWWIEGYAGRKTFSHKSLAFYIAQEQKITSSFINKFSRGNYVLDNSYISVADNFPARFYNPAVSVNLGRMYLNLVYFNDAYTRFVVVPHNDTNNTVEYSLDDLNKSNNYDVMQNNNVGRVVFNYFGNYSTVKRIIEIQRIPKAVICYNVSLLNSSLESLEISMNVNSELEIQNYYFVGDNIFLSMKDNRDLLYYMGMTIISDGDVKLPLITKNNKLSFEIHTNQTNFSVKFATVIYPKVNLLYNNIEFHDTKNYINTFGISYLVIHKDNVVDFDRFTHDSEHFKTVFEIGKILILKAL